MAIHSNHPERTIRNAVKKAQAVQPQVLELDSRTFAVASKSRPGTGHVVTLDEHSKLACTCQGFSHVGCCYHGAAVGLHLGLIPERYLRDPEPVVVDPVAAAEERFSAAMEKWRLMRGEHLAGSDPEREAFRAALSARDELEAARGAASVQLQAVA